ncbi:ferrochelatase [Eikenella longinqua]|uniref:Ferrochelatase n=1 Tax=Eikenella longinqua TaxID=1795827 RepID=A0A1A9RWS3_9NEIS|nr:ferrochelatase [Eikenella longinqua]OAM29150.1 ferrochelatase [Eikenella longinqua]
MPHFLPEPPHGSHPARVGILLINLGTPSAPTAEAVRPYLRQFLSDQRVVELPRLLWQPLLRGLILPFRAKKSAHGYRQIWQPQGSPLAVFTAKQAAALQKLLPQVLVEHAMSYGEPSVAHTLATMKAQGVDRLLVLPLYPQYAASSSGAALDKVLNELVKQRNQISLRTISRFYNHPDYIQAMAAHIRAYWQQHGRGQRILFSFHGIPEASVQQGDPYAAECRASAQLLAEALHLSPQEWYLAFQSRFGRARWIGPATDQLLTELPAKHNIRELDLFCPGFVSDCLETLEELAIQGREQFHEAGGQTFRFILCLNDNPVFIEALADIALENLGGWV